MASCRLLCNKACTGCVANRLSYAWRMVSPFCQSAWLKYTLSPNHKKKDFSSSAIRENMDSVSSSRKSAQLPTQKDIGWAVIVHAARPKAQVNRYFMPQTSGRNRQSPSVHLTNALPTL